MFENTSVKAVGVVIRDPKGKLFTEINGILKSGKPVLLKTEDKKLLTPEEAVVSIRKKFGKSLAVLAD